MDLLRIGVQILVFLISAIPLNIAVKLLKGKTHLIKTALIMILTGLGVSLIQQAFNTTAGIISFLFSAWIYHIFFRLKWIKSFLLLFVEFLVVLVIVLILLFLGISVFFI